MLSKVVVQNEPVNLLVHLLQLKFSDLCIHFKYIYIYIDNDFSFITQLYMSVLFLINQKQTNKKNSGEGGSFCCCLLLFCLWTIKHIFVDWKYLKLHQTKFAHSCNVYYTKQDFQQTQTIFGFLYSLQTKTLLSLTVCIYDKDSTVTLSWRATAVFHKALEWAIVALYLVQESCLIRHAIHVSEVCEI